MAVLIGTRKVPTVTGGSADNRPDLLASGAGTEASPFTHADGSAGIQTVASGLVRGGKLRLLPFRFDITTAPALNKHSQVLSGDAGMFNQDPNGESEGMNGTKLRVLGTVGISYPFVQDMVDGQLQDGRRGGMLLERVGFWGSGYTAGQTAVEVTGGLDQPQFSLLNMSNVRYGLAVRGAKGGLDTATLTLNVLNAGYGFINESQQGSYFNTFLGGCLADLEYCAILVDNVQAYGFLLDGVRIIRAARRTDSTRNKNAAVWLKGRQHRIVNLIIGETGRMQLPTSSNNTTPQNDLVLDCHNSYVGALTIYGNQTGGTNIVVLGNNNVIDPCNYTGQAIAGTNPGQDAPLSNTEQGFSTSSYGVLIVQGAQDNEVTHRGNCTVIDNGVRTIENNMGRSAGDPDQVEPWKSKKKREKLTVLDTLNKILYEYSRYYSNGRIVLMENVTSTSPTTGTPTSPSGSSYLYNDVAATNTNRVTRTGSNWQVDGNVLFDNSGFDSNTLTFAPNTEKAYIEMTSDNVVGFLFVSVSGPYDCEEIRVTIDGVAFPAFSQQTAQENSSPHIIYNTITAQGEVTPGTHTIRFTRWGNATMGAVTITEIRKQ